jgi:hypothetical protein
MPLLPWIRLVEKNQWRSARIRLLVSLAFSAVVACPSAVVAQTPARAPDTESAVVAVETDDLVVDFGSTRGAIEGESVELWRPLHLRHPVTGKPLTDRFIIGKLRLTQVRPTLSLAATDGALTRPAQVGDIIVVPQSPAPQALPVLIPQDVPAQVPGTGTHDEDLALSAMFEGLRGADVVRRIRAYEGFVQANPRSRRAAFLLEEAGALRQLLTLSEQSQAAVVKRARVTAEASLFRKAVAHQPLRLALAVHGKVTGVILHARRADAATYLSLKMIRSGPSDVPDAEAEYWAATLPAEVVGKPGLQYFVEAVDPEGTVAIVGSAEIPEQVDIDEVDAHAPSKTLGQAAMWTDYASFNARKANDYIWQTEGYMGARFGDTGLRALRTGFGVYRGEGGSVKDLDTLNLPPTRVGLTYGYLETEIGFTKYVSIGIRGTVGLDNSGINGGGFVFLRIGSDLGTNIWFGAEGLGGIGVRGITQFEWNAFPKWPIVLRNEITDEPAGADIGVRAIAQVGYRVLPHLVLSARGSYQGRTIDHSGPGGGAAVAYAW